MIKQRNQEWKVNEEKEIRKKIMEGGNRNRKKGRMERNRR